VSNPWWYEFFDLRVAGLILDQIRPGELDFLVRHLKLVRDCSVFDQCCGWGRVAGPLAQRGVRVWGVDASSALVEEARKRWSTEAVDFALGDATEHLPGPPCDAAMNLYSSFGYSSDDQYNQEMLNRLVGSVKTGGRLLIDTINPGRVHANFQELMTHHAPCGSTIRRRSQLKGRGTLLDQHWEFQLADGSRFERNGATRLYEVDELAEMLHQASGRPLKAFGDFGSQDYTVNSKRLIWLAEK
jgi:SAM-dependent methyltransferase